jgi:hypothetical protein
VLYATGEETEAQVARRAKRVGATNERLQLLAESSLDVVLEAARAMDGLALLIVDSAQRMRRKGRPGTNAEIKAVAVALVEFARSTGVPVILVAHVNKLDQLAGPKVLEHDADSTVSLEIAPDGTRVLRAHKNRDGSTAEIGRFAMTGRGLTPPPPGPSAAPAADKSQRVAKAAVRPSRVAKSSHADLSPGQRRIARRAEDLQCSADVASREAAAIDLGSYHRAVEERTAAVVKARAMVKAREQAVGQAERHFTKIAAAEVTTAERAAARRDRRTARCDMRLATSEARQAERNLAVAKTELKNALERKRRREEIAAARRKHAGTVARTLR